MPKISRLLDDIGPAKILLEMSTTTTTTMPHKMCWFRLRDLLATDDSLFAMRQRNGKCERGWRSCTGRGQNEQGREGLGLYFASCCRDCEGWHFGRATARPPTNVTHSNRWRPSIFGKPTRSRPTARGDTTRWHNGTTSRLSVNSSQRREPTSRGILRSTVEASPTKGEG